MLHGGANPGSLPRCSLTPHLDLPPATPGLGDGGPVPGYGHHQSVFSHFTVVRSLPTCPPEGLMATHPSDGHGRGGADGDICLFPRECVQQPPVKALLV